MKLGDVQKRQGDDLYTTTEVADFMGISYITIYRLVKSGKLKAINIAMSGKKPIWGFRAEDVQEYYAKYPAARKGDSKKDLKKAVGS